MIYKSLLFDRSKIYIAAPKYFCYLRYTHMNIVFVVFTYSRPDNHFVHALYHCIHNFVLSKVLDGGRTVFAIFQLDRTADGLKKRIIRSDGRLTGAGVLSLGPYRIYTIWTLWF